MSKHDIPNDFTLRRIMGCYLLDYGGGISAKDLSVIQNFMTRKTILDPRLALIWGVGMVFGEKDRLTALYQHPLTAENGRLLAKHVLGEGVCDEGSPLFRLVATGRFSASSLKVAEHHIDLHGLARRAGLPEEKEPGLSASGVDLMARMFMAFPSSARRFDDFFEDNHEFNHSKNDVYARMIEIDGEPDLYSL